MLIDCDLCQARDSHLDGPNCRDCVVTVLLGPMTTLDASERTALAVLADSGLVPPLRLVRRDIA